MEGSHPNYTRIFSQKSHCQLDLGICDTGHRTAVEFRAAIEDEVGLGPLQLDPLGDLTVQGPLVGADNLALEHGHVSLVLRMVDIQVLVKGVRLNSVSDIRFMDINKFRYKLARAS